MEQFVVDFEHAVALFATARKDAERIRSEYYAHLDGPTPFSPEAMQLNKQIQTFTAWQAMACRDGAMQLYHMETVMRLIGKTLKAAPTLRAHVDHKMKREALKIFAKAFPNAKNIRDAVGHSFAELSLHDGFIRHVATKVDIPPQLLPTMLRSSSRIH